MDIAFHGLINMSVVIYLDDIKMFSKKRGDHLMNLRQIFERCRKYRILLNPKKSIFVVTKGNILGYLISKEGIVIDIKRTKSITTVAHLNNKKVIQSFLGKIKFMHRFISIFVEIIKPLKGMIKKDGVFKWNH